MQDGTSLHHHVDASGDTKRFVIISSSRAHALSPRGYGVPPTLSTSAVASKCPLCFRKINPRSGTRHAHHELGRRVGV